MSGDETGDGRTRDRARMAHVEGPASRLVGANPGGALRRVSLAVRGLLARAIPEGEESVHAVLVAVSGGQDSMALAVCALDVCDRRGIVSRTLTVDHGLREGSADEARRVVARLAALGADARVVRVDGGLVASSPGGRGACGGGDEDVPAGRDRVRQGGASSDGPEATARRARLEAVDQEALCLSEERRSAAGTCRVLVLEGHTMDDQAETVLLRLARGSGVGSLRAMAPMTWRMPGRVRIARPLLGIRRADTRECCEQLGVAWVVDPTNSPEGPWRAADGSALRRAAVRARVLPVLADALGGDPVPALARTAQLAARDDDALDEQANRLWEQVVRVHQVPADTSRAGSPAGEDAVATVTIVECDSLALARASEALRDRVVHRAILEAGANPGSVTGEHVARVSALVANWRGQGRVDLPGATARRLPGGLLMLRRR